MDRKGISPFFSEFFNTDCLVVEGVSHFSITGATKTLYGHTGGSSLESLRKHLQKTAGLQNPDVAGDLGDFPGILPVCIERPQGGQQAALAMTQDTFKSLLKLYRGKDTKAGCYVPPGIRINKRGDSQSQMGALDKTPSAMPRSPRKAC